MERRPHAGADTSARLRETLDDALAARDRAGAIDAATNAVTSGALSVPLLYLEVLSPLLADTGTGWQRGATRIWEEHYATATVRTIVESLAPYVIAEARAVDPRGDTVLLACPPSEYHDLGLRMTFDRFLLAGFHAHFLGADTPVGEICDAAKQLTADIVVLSASTHYHRVRLRSVIEELKRGLPQSTRIAVGGPAFLRDAEDIPGLVLDLGEFGLPGSARREGS